MITALLAGRNRAGRISCGSRPHPRTLAAGSVELTRPFSGMHSPVRTSLLAVVLLLAAVRPAAAEAKPVPVPTVTDRRLALTLVAREPDIVTPVGIAIDGAGRLFVVESNTHFRPDQYAGPRTDRVKRFEDRDGDGRFEQVSVFAEGFTFAMNVAFAPDGALYLVERSRVVRLEDANGDGRADRQRNVLTLETAATYPHNGLGSLAFGPDGMLYVGLGENRGARYALRGSDGLAVTGEGEGGAIFRCRADGAGVQRIATGLWNPFSLAFFAGTHLLAVDDDPEVRPPDRLLDVVDGADFGFKMRYGTAAEHPFVAWKGELPGTLPMVSAVGEGVTSIVAGSAAALPAGYGSAVLISSWSDRRIEVHRLRPHGASLRGRMSILVQGDEFRPVSFAVAPDGSIFFTDWVKRRYELHGHGRIWRLGRVDRSRARPTPPRPSAARRRLERVLATAPAQAARLLPPALADGDPFIRTAAVESLSAPALHATARTLAAHGDARVRVGAALALRRAGLGELVERFLGDVSEEVRIVALIWAAEERVLERAAAIHAAVDGRPPSPRLVAVYRAAAAALDVPVRPAFAPAGREQLLEGLERPSADRARMQEATWRLASEWGNDEAVLARLELIALDRAFDAQVRADAVAALAMQGRVRRLTPLLADGSPRIRIEAARALRVGAADPEVRQALAGALAAARRGSPLLREELRFALADDSVPALPRPPTVAAWRAAAGGGDVDAGRRVFTNPMSGCARCHRVGALGGHLGPPLTYIGNDRPERLLESLLEPARDVVWPARTVTTKDGTQVTGMLWKRADDGSITLGTAAGQPVTIAGDQVASETEAEGSLMPDGLQDTMTVAAFRDLFAFLRAQNR